MFPPSMTFLYFKKENIIYSGQEETLNFEIQNKFLELLL